MKYLLTTLLCLFVFNGAQAASPCAGTDSVVRILAIGNSFSEDALDTHFHKLCEAAGKQVVVGDLYIGGCPIDRHWLNARTDSAAYRFRRIGLDGATIQAQNVRLGDALGSDNWDFVSFQQASGVSGLYATFSNLPLLINYVADRTPADTRFVWHQTWAYAPDSDHGEFPNYNRDQQTMYHAINDACAKAMADNPRLSLIVPSGSAVQIARQKSGDYNLTRDGYHLSKLLGRYIASCAWYEAIFGENVIGNSYVPQGLTPEQARMAQEAAHEAATMVRTDGALPCR